MTAPHWSPDFEFKDWQHSTESAETTNSWQATELTLDNERTLTLDSEPPAQDEFPEFLCD